MDQRRLRTGWTRVQVRNTRVGEWIHTEDSHRNLLRKEYHDNGTITLHYLDGGSSPRLPGRMYITVNYPRIDR